MATDPLSRSVSDPLRPMSWLDWQRHGEDYTGGEYRIRLIRAFQWEVLAGAEHLRYHQSLSLAMDEAEGHYRERLRAKDMRHHGALAALAIAAMSLVVESLTLGTIGSLVLFAAFLYVCLTSLGRFMAAATRNRFDPFRRRAPWERGDQRHL